MDEMIDAKLDLLIANLPDCIPNYQLPDPNLIEHYKNEGARVHWIDSEISDNLLFLVKKIIMWNAEDTGKPVDERKPIKVMISSPGGDASTMWSVIQAIQTSKTPIYTINFSYAYSAAAEIFVAGHKRFALKGCTFMFHRGSCYYGGEQSSVESTQKFMKAQEKKYVDFLLSHTKIDPKLYNKKASSDIWLDEFEAIKMGVADEIVEDFDSLM